VISETPDGTVHDLELPVQLYVVEVTLAFASSPRENTRERNVMTGIATRKIPIAGATTRTRRAVLRDVIDKSSSPRLVADLPTGWWKLGPISGPTAQN